MKGAIVMVGGALLAVSGLYLVGTSHGKPVGFLGLAMFVVGTVSFLYGGGKKDDGGQG